jgi:plasmid stabilization system protein ParE
MGNWVNKSSQSKDDNLETFSLIWLDAKVNKTRDNRRAQQKLRHIINHIKIFKDQQQCEQYILLLSPQDRVVLIVSGQCGRQLVPQIHQLRQISSIYVYCMDKEGNEQWAKDYTKV